MKHHPPYIFHKRMFLRINMLAEYCNLLLDVFPNAMLQVVGMGEMELKMRVLNGVLTVYLSPFTWADKTAGLH